MRPNTTHPATTADLPDLAPIRSREEELAAMWAMTLPERIEAMRAGRLTRRQLFAWAGASPTSVPTINGEFEFIAVRTPEVAEATASASVDPLQLARQILQDLGILERRWATYQRQHPADLATQLVLGE